MSAPTCTCHVEWEFDQLQARVILCPLHAHASDLYEALERTNNILGNQPHRDGFGIIEQRLELNFQLLAKARGEAQ